MARYDDFTIIIPTLDEEKNIGRLLKALDGMYDKIKIIVSDDGSKDQTQAVVKRYSKINPLVALLDRSRCSDKGLTASVIDGIYKAKTDFVIIMDSDFQHPPEAVAEIAHALKKGKDIVVGARRKISERWPIHRKIMSKTAIMLGRMRLAAKGIYCKDVMSGFFGAKRPVFIGALEKESKFELAGYKVLFDLLKYCRKGTSIAEVYYDFGLRKDGNSKINSSHMLSYLRSLFK